jgi:trk system potassium uptake protein TrkA
LRDTGPPTDGSENRREVDVRSKYNVNIIGIKNNSFITPFVSPNHMFRENEHLVIAGAKKTAWL